MKSAFILLPCLALPLLAVDGVVVNATTQKPQAGVAISLVQPSQNGMVPLGQATTDAQGRFTIDKTIPPGPGLLQATFQGATYNQILTPNMPTTGVQIRVFESTDDPVVAIPVEHLVLFEPGESELKVNETFVFQNATIRTFNDPNKGSLQIYLPPAAEGKARAVITAPGGMPIPRTPMKTARAGFYKIDYPIKPGETRMDIDYSMPPTKTFAGKVTGSAANVHLVSPASVTLTGKGVENQGQEPQTQAHVYNLTGNDYEITIEGTGSLRQASADNGGGGSGEDTGSPKIEVQSAKIYSKLGWVLGLALGILALGGTMLFRRGTV